MKLNPILPVWIVTIILILCIGILSYRLYKKETSLQNKVFSILRIALITLLVFFLNLRIMKPTYTRDALLKNIDVLFVVDNTISMYAEENNKIRMDRVKDDTRRIMDELDGGNFALIRFDNKSQILSPFTQDKRNISDALEVISYPDSYYAKGSSLNTPYEDMAKLLESSNKKDNKMTILFFISDGEITDNSTLTTYNELNNLVDGGAVLGYGSEEGGTMTMKNLFSYNIIDPTTGEDAVSKIDKETLDELGSMLHLPVYYMQEDNNLEPLLRKIINNSSSYIGSTNTVDYDDIYFYFAYPLIALLLLEIYLYFRKGKI